MTVTLIHQIVRKPVKLAAAASCLVVAFTGGLAIGQQQPPSENKGVSAKLMGEVRLGTEIEGMGGRLLRLRVVTLEPAGVFALHNHKDRPAVEFIMTGSPTEFSGSETHEKKEGDAVVSDKNTTHWWRNDGRVPVVFVVADIFNPPKP